MERAEQKKVQAETRQGLPSEHTAGVPPFRAETYWQYLDGLDLTEAQKASVLEALWLIMVGFVDLGFAADPVQHIFPMLVHGAMQDEAGTAGPAGELAGDFGAVADSAAREKQD